MQTHPEISALLNTYFQGLYNGNAELLRTVFHPQAMLFGDISGKRFQITLESFLQSTGSKKSPRDLGEEFRMRALDIQPLNQMAQVKAHCPMLGRNYIDYLSLINDGERWLISQKLFTHLEEAQAA